LADNVFDIASDILKERLDLAKGIISQNFKGAKPYRKEPVAPRERLYWYSLMDEQTEANLRANFGDSAVDGYKLKMTQLKERYGGKG